MAIAKDLIVLGKTRHTGDVYAGTIYAEHFVMNGSSADYVLLGDGTHIALSTFAVSSHTHSIKINGTTHSVGTSLVDLGNYLPTAGGTMTGHITMGTNHYIYGVNETSGSMLHFDGNRTVIGSLGTSTTAATLIRSKTGHAQISDNTNTYTILDSGNYTNYTNQYVKLDAGAAEQAIKSSVTTPTKGIINLWMNDGDKEAFLGFSNGTTEKYLGGIGFRKKDDHDIYFKRTIDNTTSNVEYFKLVHTGNIGLYATAGAFVIDPQDRRITVSKSTNSTWDAQVYSAVGYMDAIILSFKIGQTGKK